MEYSGNYIYEQGGRRDAGASGQTGGVRLGEHLGEHVPFNVCKNLKETHFFAWI